MKEKIGDEAERFLTHPVFHALHMCLFYVPRTRSYHALNAFYAASDKCIMSYKDTNSPHSHLRNLLRCQHGKPFDAGSYGPHKHQSGIPAYTMGGLCVVGGVTGFVRTRSVPSLVAGVGYALSFHGNHAVRES